MIPEPEQSLNWRKIAIALIVDSIVFDIILVMSNRDK